MYNYGNYDQKHLDNYSASDVLYVWKHNHMLTAALYYSIILPGATAKLVIIGTSALISHIITRCVHAFHL